MSLAQRELISPQTAAATSAEFVVNGRNPVTIFASNLAGSENVDIQFKTGDVQNPWVALAEDGSTVVLSTTNNAEVIAAPGTYRVLKDVTAGDCGVYLATEYAAGEVEKTILGGENL